MKSETKRIRSACCLLYLSVVVVGIVGVQAFAADWPQFRGPNRNGVSEETNLLKSWPDGGPEMLWAFEELGAGYSSPAIAGGTIYITGEIDKKETIFALNLNGNLKWKTSYGSLWNRSYPVVRTTPTVDGDNIYVSSGRGQAVCFDTKTGKIRWSIPTLEKYNGEYHQWGVAESPLVVDDKVIFTPGGKDASIVALNKLTGATVWTSKGLSEKANYCSPILIERGGRKIITTMLQNSFVGIDAQNGQVLWQDRFADFQGEHKDINPVSPVYHDGKIYHTSGYDDGGAIYELSADGTKITRKWVDKTLDCHVGGVVFVNGFIYGSNWENNRNGNWVCLDWSTGQVMYETKWNTKGSIITAEGLLYCYEEKDGHVALVKAVPSGFDIISSFQVTKGSKQHWAHPAISDGRLFIRHGEALMAYDIKAE